MYQNLESHLLYEQKIMWKVLVSYESLSTKKLFCFASTLTSLFQNKTVPVFVPTHGTKYRLCTKFVDFCASFFSFFKIFVFKNRHFTHFCQKMFVLKENKVQWYACYSGAVVKEFSKKMSKKVRMFFFCRSIWMPF